MTAVFHHRSLVSVILIAACLPNLAPGCYGSPVLRGADPHRRIKR